MRACSRARFPLPPLPFAACAPGLSPARALPPPASLLPPPPRGTEGGGLPPNSDLSLLDLHSVLGRRGRAHAVVKLCLRPPVSLSIPARGCGVDSDPGSPQSKRELDHRCRSSDGMLSPLLG